MSAPPVVDVPKDEATSNTPTVEGESFVTKKTGWKPYKPKFSSPIIKKIMQADPETPMVAKKALVATSAALEAFLKDVATCGAEIAGSRGTKRVTPPHLKAVFHKEERFDVLRELVEDVPDLGTEPEKPRKKRTKKDVGEGGQDGSEKKKRKKKPNAETEVKVPTNSSNVPEATPVTAVLDSVTSTTTATTNEVITTQVSDTQDPPQATTVPVDIDAATLLKSRKAATIEDDDEDYDDE